MSQALSIRVVSAIPKSASSEEKYEEVLIVKNSGDSELNRNVTISLKDLNDGSNLYVEVRDILSEDKKLIGFAAIPISQVTKANGSSINGLFDIFNTESETSMVLNLQLAAAGIPSSTTPELNDKPIPGKSIVQGEHYNSILSAKSNFSKDEPVIEDWENNHRYISGVRVNYQVKVYQCIMEHTSNFGWTPTAAFTL